MTQPLISPMSYGHAIDFVGNGLYRRGEYSSYETADAILYAIEAISYADLLEDESPNAARALWADDPHGLVAAYLQRHFTAEEGDTLDWGAGSLTYLNGRWRLLHPLVEPPARCSQCGEPAVHPALPCYKLCAAALASLGRIRITMGKR